MSGFEEIYKNVEQDLKSKKDLPNLEDLVIPRMPQVPKPGEKVVKSISVPLPRRDLVFADRAELFINGERISIGNVMIRWDRLGSERLPSCRCDETESNGHNQGCPWHRNGNIKFTLVKGVPE